jgi:geranylgeranyl diphosphate synthase type I
MATFGELLDAVRRRLDARLEQWLQPRVAAARAISAVTGQTAQAAAELTLRGGKRMRAALVAAGFGQTDWSPSEPAMIAIELLQTYLLIHDDWMDHDDVRRGGPAVHVVLGDAGAVLAGDLASGWAQEALLESELPPPALLSAAREYARIQVDVVTGQVAEMGGGAPVETVHALKTASYTVTGPLLVGAALAGADDARRAALARFGRPLGIAFQLRDDVLGVFGDPVATGKPVGNDLRQGKRTALIDELRTDPKLDALLERARGGSDQDIATLIHAIEASGARVRVEARIRELCEEARGVLGEIDLSQHARQWLEGAVTALGERTK